MRPPALIFDLDGTLVDSVYEHVLAWREALEQSGIDLPVWRIHRKIGMSGGLFTRALVRETGAEMTPELSERLQQAHVAAYQRLAARVRPLPGARDLLARLTALGIRWTIATSGRHAAAAPTLAALGVPADVPVVTRDLVPHAKPDPDLLIEAARRIGVDAARRARALGVGLLSGGYGEDELTRAGAYRVYEDPRDLLRHLDEIGVRAHAP